MSRSTLRNWCRKLAYFYKRRSKTVHVNQQFDVDVVSPYCNYIKNNTPAQVFSYKFCEFFQPTTLLKTRPTHRYFLVDFEKFFGLQLLHLY